MIADGNLQYGQVVNRIATYKCGWIGVTVIKFDGNSAGACGRSVDNVIVSDDIAGRGIGLVDRPRTSISAARNGDINRDNRR